MSWIRGWNHTRSWVGSPKPNSWGSSSGSYGRHVGHPGRQEVADRAAQGHRGEDEPGQLAARPHADGGVGHGPALALGRDLGAERSVDERTQVLHGDVLDGHAVGAELHVEGGQRQAEHVAAVLGVVPPPHLRALPLVDAVATRLEAALLVEKGGHRSSLARRRDGPGRGNPGAPPTLGGWRPDSNHSWISSPRERTAPGASSWASPAAWVSARARPRPRVSRLLAEDHGIGDHRGVERRLPLLERRAGRPRPHRPQGLPRELRPRAPSRPSSPPSAPTSTRSSVPVYDHLFYDVLSERAEVVPSPGRDPRGVNVLHFADQLDLGVYVDAAEPDMRRWYVERVLTLRRRGRRGARCLPGPVRRARRRGHGRHRHLGVGDGEPSEPPRGHRAHPGRGPTSCS